MDVAEWALLVRGRWVSMPTYFITDIHGERDKFEALLARLSPKPADKIILGGDYVDRGPDSYAVVERVLALRQECELVCLNGNHDAEFAKGIIAAAKQGGVHDASTYPLWPHGAEIAYRSYERAGVDPSVHLPFFLGLDAYHVHDNKLFVHAGMHRHHTIANPVFNNPQVLMWDRDFLKLAYFNNETSERWQRTGSFATKEKFDMVFLGHTPVQMFDASLSEPMLLRHSKVMACDTGTGKHDGAVLYAVDVDTLQCIGHDGRLIVHERGA